MTIPTFSEFVSFASAAFAFVYAEAHAPEPEGAAAEAEDVPGKVEGPGALVAWVLAGDVLFK